jgi:hypothetical protein
MLWILPSSTHMMVLQTQVNKLYNSTLEKEKYYLKLDEIMLLNASMNIIWCPKDEEKVGYRFCCGCHQKCLCHTMFWMFGLS